jgi:hypothetical protein
MVFTGTQKGFCRVFPWPRRGEDNINHHHHQHWHLRQNQHQRQKKIKPLTFTSRLEWGVLPFNTICFGRFICFIF